MPYFCRSSRIYRLIKVSFNYFVVTEVATARCCALLTFGDLGAAAFLGNTFLVVAFVLSIYSVIFIWESVFNRCKQSIDM